MPRYNGKSIHEGSQWREKNHKMGMSTCTREKEELGGGRVEQLERNSLLTGALNELAIKAAVKGVRERGAGERGDNLLSIWVEFLQA